MPCAVRSEMERSSATSRMVRADSPRSSRSSVLRPWIAACRSARVTAVASSLPTRSWRQVVHVHAFIRLLRRATELIEGAEAMASAMNDRHAAEVARERFVGLIDRFPGWGEPLNKLATLEYLLGDYAGAARLCHDTLAIKPHHFGALSGLVQCELARGDLEAAQNAAMRLHNLQPSFAADLLEDIRARRQGRRRGPGSY